MATMDTDIMIVGIIQDIIQMPWLTVADTWTDIIIVIVHIIVDTAVAIIAVIMIIITEVEEDMSIPHQLLVAQDETKDLLEQGAITSLEIKQGQALWTVTQQHVQGQTQQHRAVQ